MHYAMDVRSRSRSRSGKEDIEFGWSIPAFIRVLLCYNIEKELEDT